MIKAKIGNVAVLGITEENIKLLKEGKPVRVKLKEMNMPDIEVVILYGKTEQDIYNELKPGIDPLKTIIHHERGSKEN